VILVRLQLFWSGAVCGLARRDIDPASVFLVRSGTPRLHVLARGKNVYIIVRFSQPNNTSQMTYSQKTNQEPTKNLYIIPDRYPPAMRTISSSAQLRSKWSSGPKSLDSFPKQTKYRAYAQTESVGERMKQHHRLHDFRAVNNAILEIHRATSPWPSEAYM